MTFSPQWEGFYSNPESHYRTMSGNLSFLFSMLGSLQDRRLLEFGCGIGNNAWPLMHQGADYYGIDGSSSAIIKAQSFANTKNGKFLCADFTRENPFGGEFDAIFDRAGIAHNDTEGIKRAIQIILESLLPGGLFIGCDWFGTGHSEAQHGVEVDARTRIDYASGQFVNVGKVHFTDEEELTQLFSDFESVLILERTTRYPQIGKFMKCPLRYKWVSDDFIGKQYISQVWDFIVRKPE